ncbi:Transmembrane exosortase (Exosortase_EpsH) [Poriferisphaera corsica]|uniref:Transmembrane exosortase (Exosortase_EpsH) n=1 Tax=Poriferisphaera corsica TaxID=2528020 RepID=A0A517YWC0_9BACT|nr:exosortase/archaeosortase family protein [Poriferisphaera corsica]QDU34535.1 Transmembrane exosortase (Exosortase_EpsH) [Poriferisphaera corsica]
MSQKIYIVPRVLSRNGWTMMHLAFLVIMLVIGCFFTRLAWQTIWLTAVYYQHALYVILIPFISIWLFYVRRHRMRFCAPVSTWVGPLIVLAGWFIYAYGQNLNVATIWMIGALLIVFGCGVSVVGTDVLSKFVPAFVVLVFLIPVPTPVASVVSLPVQIATTDVTQVIYGLMGVEIQREGMLLFNDDGIPISIAHTGRVVALFMTFLLMSYAFAFGMPLRPIVRLIVIGSSPFIALFVNIIRSLATTWMYNVYDPISVYHFMAYIAWGTLILTVLVLYMVIRLLLWTSIPLNRFSIPKDT